MMGWAGAAYYLVDGLAKPYTVLILWIGMAIGHLWKRKRESRGKLLLVAGPFGVLAALSMPVVAYLALGTLEWGYPPRDVRPARARAIVVLSGSIIARDAVRTHDLLGDSSLYRCLEAARAYKVGSPVDVVATGGKLDPGRPGRPCAELMAEFLATQGVNPHDLIVENRARTTYENAVETRKILEPKNVKCVLLVTDATHMKRAVLCFQKQGFEVVPWPASHRATEFPSDLKGFLPTPYAFGDVLTAAHEWMGLAWYGIAGKF